MINSAFRFTFHKGLFSSTNFYPLSFTLLWLPRHWSGCTLLLPSSLSISFKFSIPFELCNQD